MRFLISVAALCGLAVAGVAGSSGYDAWAQQAKSAAPAGSAKRKILVPKKAAVEAKVLFGAAAVAAAMPPRAIGSYARGCLAGAEALAIDGAAWQAMRLSRNRNWGHPTLVRLVERLATDAKAHDGWPGLLVGDLSQPRGGPMLTGHASHQVGLDADIWLTPMPDRRLTHTEREDLAATSMLGPDGVAVDPKIWTAEHGKLIARAAAYPEVDRVFVHPAIKKAMCDQPGLDRRHLRKVQPYWGHHYHMHIRISCPAGSEGCANQTARPADDGCGAELEGWMKLLRRPPAPTPPPITDAKPRPKPRVTLDQLPKECRGVINAGRVSPVGETTRSGPIPR